MDTIFVENLVLVGIHGATAKEQLRSQPFRIDISVDVTDALPLRDDCIEEVLDYRTLKRAAEQVVTHEHHTLVETIADRIIELIFANERALAIRVTVRKTTIWNTGIPGITRRRSR